MILTIDESQEFLEFARICSNEQYRLYLESKTGHWILRPKESSKNLDTAIFTSEAPDNLLEFLEKEFDEAIKIKEVVHFRE